jgi:hypothetical protein
VEEGNTEKGNLLTIVKVASQAFVIAVTVLCFTPLTRGFDVRTLSTQENVTTYYTPSVPLSVTIRVIPDKGTQSYAVEDMPPKGWVVTGINENGQWDDVNKRVKWGPFPDRNMRTFVYQVTAPVGETGIKIFSGIVIFDGIATSIVGDLVVEPALLGPADGRQGVRSP